MILIAVAQGQPLLQHGFDLQRETGRGRRGDLRHLLTAANQVPVTGLVAGTKKLIVNAPLVV